MVVCLICVILTFFICSGVNMAYNYLQEEYIVENYIVENITEEEIQEIPKEEKEYISKEEFEDNWTVEIPSIGLNAPISEGTSQEVMSKYVGHFENTEVWEGNIGLAAHNRRMPGKLFWKN